MCIRDRDTPEAHFYIGNCQTRLHQYDAALAAYDQALAQRPGWPEALFNRDIDVYKRQPAHSAAAAAMP